MRSRRTRHKWGFRLAATTAAVLPFLLLEIGLQVLTPPNDREKLNQGLKATIPLFSLDESDNIYSTSLPYQQFFAEVSFRPKAARQVENAKRQELIFVLGGSTVQGRPFAPATAFPAWAECLLNEPKGDTAVRIVNCGGVSFASNRLRQIVPELLTYAPDMIVIATGHNEFLEDHTYFQTGATSTPTTNALEAFKQLRTVRLIQSAFVSDPMPDHSDRVEFANHEVNAKLDNEAGYDTYHYDAAWHHTVVNQFQRSLEDIVNQCEAVDVPIVLVDLACNSRDCAPFKSEHSPAVSEQSRAEWGLTMQKAEAAMESGKWDEAISYLQSCVENSPEHALTHFRLARCFRATNDILRASQHFQLAIDYDVCPLRMKSELREVLKTISAQHSIPRLDCAEALKSHSEDATMEFGFDLFLDHVHPTVRAHQAIGRELARLISTTKSPSLPELQNPDGSNPLRFKEAIDDLPTTYFANGRRRIGWLEKWARAQKTATEVQPMTVSDVVQRIRRRLELGDEEHALELFSVLPGGRERGLAIMNLHQQFCRSGQDQTAANLLSLVAAEEETINDADTTEREYRNSNWGDSLLTDVQKTHVREILNRTQAD